MGKAAEKRKAARARYLSKLLASNPKRFEEELNKRFTSWAGEAWKRAGTLNGPSSFSVLDEARQALVGCQSSGVTRTAEESLAALAHECARALSAHTDGRLYQVTQSLKKKP